nr:LacI family DNA-binding transcriptional regulator [Burkholderia diffusa]
MKPFLSQCGPETAAAIGSCVGCYRAATGSKAAGVSRTAVSFVLNNVPDTGISLETRERILLAANRLSYVPNAMARSLVSGATRPVALLIPQGDHANVNVHAYIPRFLAVVNLTCHAHGYKVLLEPM